MTMDKDRALLSELALRCERNEPYDDARATDHHLYPYA